MRNRSEPKDIDLNRLAGHILSLLGSPKSHDTLIANIVALIQKKTGFESIGLRLQEGLDFPYYFTGGFAPDFVEKEMHLCACDQAGEIIQDSEGNPYLECMCGNVIAGRTDPSYPFFTTGGSFWTNSTSTLLAETAEEDRQTRTRNRCNGEGYESVGLIPVQMEKTTFGLLQLNDRRKGMFTQEFVRFMEGVTSSIALLFSLIRQKANLAVQVEDVQRVISVRTKQLEMIAYELKQTRIKGAKKTTSRSVLEKIDQMMEEIETLKGLLPICMRCKKIRNDIGHWERIEKYIWDRAKIDWTHTYCPECYQIAIEELEKDFESQ
jgi:GAF domain-containing protein